MGILGLTHDENGAALEKLPVTIKVAIGEGPEPGRKTATRAGWTILFSSGKRCGAKTWSGLRRRTLLRRLGRSQPNWG